MKVVLSSKRHHYIARVSIFLITVALIAGMVGCGSGGVEYNLAIFSTAGGSVTTPDEGIFTYDEGEVVDLVAVANEGYVFDGWVGDVSTIADDKNPTTTITMNGDYIITANFVAQYVLTIDSTDGGEVTAPGEGIFNYDEGTDVDLVAVADEGYLFVEWTGDVSTIADVEDATTAITMNDNYYITATFAVGICDWYDLDVIRDNLDGGYILTNDLDSTTAGYAELASPTANGGKGWQPIGSLYPGPTNWDTVESIDPFAGSFDGQGYEIRDLFIDCPDEGCVGLFGWLDSGGIIQDVGVVDVTVIGSWDVGGLVGRIGYGAVSNSYSTGSVTGVHGVGGLVGRMDYGYGTVSNSYSTGSVTGHGDVGGLVGSNDQGTISGSYSTGNVAGDRRVGGLVGFHGFATISNSYYDYDEVLINGENVITIGALFNEDFEQWLANDKFLDVNERLSQENGYYLINNVSDFKELLAFGQDSSLKFRLETDLDLETEANFYIPYLAGEFDGNGHKITELSFNFDFVSDVGLFGYLAFSGKVSEVGVESVDITGGAYVGGLGGESAGTVSSSYSGGSVTATEWVGGLVGWNNGIMSNSYSTGSVTGQSSVGGLAGKNTWTVSNSYYNYNEVLISGRNVITVGALFEEDFEQWLANDKFLDVNERLSKENGYYVINNVSDFKQLLAFGQNDTLNFRLTNDLDLATEPNFYIPYLAGEFDGNGHKISNLSFSFDFVAQVGLFGLLASGGKVSEVGVENVNITGSWNVGGLVGVNGGSIDNCYSTGSVTGYQWVGGLVGANPEGTVSNSYFTGSVTGHEYVGGLVGHNRATVSNSFWDIQTSGQSASAGGTGKTTAEMQDIATFSGAAWNIIAVTSGETNPTYTWNIIDGETYPFLSWQSVS